MRVDAESTTPASCWRASAPPRDETDLELLTSEMLRVVNETVQPEFVGLWLRSELSPHEP